MDPIEGLPAIRRRAADEAEAELGVLGFSKGEEGTWTRGPCPESGGMALSVRLPAAFPDAVPEVFLKRDILPRRIPHVEENGKVCIAPEGGVLLDVDAPRQILREAISRAESTIRDGISGALDKDFHTEFLAYWGKGSLGSIIWTFDAPTEPAPLCLAMLEVGDSGFCPQAVGASLDTLKAWANRVGHPVRSLRPTFYVPLKPAFYLPLTGAFVPPDFGEAWSFEQCLKVIHDHVEESHYELLLDWLASPEVQLPATIFLSLPSSEGDSRILFAVLFPGFPAGKPRPSGPKPKNAAEAIGARLGDPISRLEVERADPEFVIVRGGAASNLRKCIVAIIGCGALGSQAAKQLALSGVGALRLIDPDKLGPENVQRHLLGARHLGRKKVDGIAAELQADLPHLRIETRASRVEEILQSEPDFVRGVSAILISTGDETLDRRLNSLLAGGPPRVFSWLEALGAGGHGLLVGIPGQAGCLDCLYQTVGSGAIGNVAAFIAHGQDLGRSVAGCSGRFLPFSAIDAGRTATEATALVIEALTNPDARNVLMSRFGDPQALTSLGAKLSKRADHFTPGLVIRRTDFARGDCKSCRAR